MARFSRQMLNFTLKSIFVPYGKPLTANHGLKFAVEYEKAMLNHSLSSIFFLFRVSLL